MSQIATMSPASGFAPAAIDPAAAAIVAARLTKLARRLDDASLGIAGADPGDHGLWRGPARAAFTAARSLAHARLVAAADAAGDAAAMATRAADLAAMGA